MDASAIKEIQESANIPALLEQVDDGLEGAVAIIPESMRLVSLEAYMPKATRYRGKFDTSSINDFEDYSKKFKQNGSICFVHPDDVKAKTVLDLGTLDLPGHSDHVAILKLNKTAAFDALLEVNGYNMPQKKAAEFLEEWASEIKVTSQNGEEMPILRAASAIRDITIDAARMTNNKVSDFGESSSAMERIEAKNEHALPSILKFSCVPYHGLRVRVFLVRFSILTGGDRPAVIMRILHLESQREDMAEEFKGLLVSAFENGGPEVFIGEW
jgi:uncharacterized protein YfdQ (DUF2303 family)